MTDEDVEKVALQVYGTPYPNIRVRLAAAVRAGYRAGLEEAKKNHDDLRPEGWSYKSSWENHGEWLDAKLKEQP